MQSFGWWARTVAVEEVEFPIPTFPCPVVHSLFSMPAMHFLPSRRAARAHESQAPLLSVPPLLLPLLLLFCMVTAGDCRMQWMDGTQLRSTSTVQLWYEGHWKQVRATYCSRPVL